MEEDEKIAKLLSQNIDTDTVKSNKPDDDIEIARKMQMELDANLAKEYLL